MSTFAAYLSSLGTTAPTTTMTDESLVDASAATTSTAVTTVTTDSFATCPPESELAATFEILPNVDFGDLTEVVSGAGAVPLGELQAAAEAILKHIVPSLLGDQEEAVRSMLSSLATVLATSRDVADSQGIRNALADWVKRISDTVGQPVLDALRAESASAPSPPAIAQNNSVSSSPQQVASQFLTTPLPGGGGDDWAARVPPNIQAQIAANGGLFTGYAMLLTQTPRDVNDNSVYGPSSVWWSGQYVAERSAMMVEYRDENGNLVYANPSVDPITGLPRGILDQAGVYFQMGVNYSESGASVGGFQGVGIVDPSFAGWEQAPTLCLDEVKEVLTAGLRQMGVPDELIPLALESCYKYDPAFGVLIPEGVGQAAMQMYQGRHGDWYDAVFEAIPAIIVGVVAPQLVGLVAPALSGAAAAVVSAGVAGGINAALNGGDILTGVLTGMVAAYGGALAGEWTSALGELGSRAASAMVSNAIRQIADTGAIDMRSLFAAGVGAGLTVELSKLPNLPQWAASGLAAAAASLALTGGDASAAAAAFLVAAGQVVASSGTAPGAATTGVSGATSVLAPRDGVLELQVTYEGRLIDQGGGSGTLVELPGGGYAITTANHLFTDPDGNLLFRNPVTGEESVLGEGGWGLAVMYNGRAITIPMNNVITNARVDDDGAYQYGTPRSNVANDAMAIFLPAGWAAANIPDLASTAVRVSSQPLTIGETVTIAGFPGEVDEHGNRPFSTSTGTIMAIRPDQGIFVRWTIDEYNAAVAGGMSGGKVYNAAGELVGVFNGEVKVVGNNVIGVFSPVRIDANGNILVGLGQVYGGGSTTSGGQGN